MSWRRVMVRGVKLLDLINGTRTAAHLAAEAAEFEQLASLSLLPGESLGSGGTPDGVVSPSASLYRAQSVAMEVALSIPAMRRARHKLLTIATLTFAAWEGGTRLDATDPRCAWMAQPDPTRTRQWLLSKTIDDLLWHDKCVWAVERDLAGRAKYFRRVHPERWQANPSPRDPDTTESWLLDGRLMTPAEFAVGHLVFDGAGLGGLRRFGWSILELYADLQAAAGRYANSPHPAAILHNKGAHLTDDEVQALLDDWEISRGRRVYGYTSDELEYQEIGWNAKELQLVEAREHAALEIARLVGLPAAAIDASSGDSMTYGNVTSKRKELAEDLRPWAGVITQTLSLNDRTGRVSGIILPAGVRAEFDFDAYTRDDPKTRMETWQLAKESGALTPEEIRGAEPLATTDTTQGVPTP